MVINVSHMHDETLGISVAWEHKYKVEPKLRNPKKKKKATQGNPNLARK
jgi:hypothetical protein